MLFCLMTLSVQTVFAQEDSSSTDGEETVDSGAVAMIQLQKQLQSQKQLQNQRKSRANRLTSA